MKKAEEWDNHYRCGDPPWDSGVPSLELMRVVNEEKIAPCRTLEIGCGTGTNAVWLAQQGFDVTGLDVSALAIEKATRRAAEAGVQVRFLAGDITQPPPLGEPFRFVFDRGCYHAVRRDNLPWYLTALQQLCAPGCLGLVLAGNAKEPKEPGPPVVTVEEIRAELGQVMTVVRLREFRFDGKPGSDENFLGWSCLLRKD